MVLSVKTVTAFPEGSSLLGYEKNAGLCLVANPIGLIKVYDIFASDSEPKSIDINENLTNLSIYGNQIAITNYQGDLEIASLNDLDSKGNLYQSELPLRDVIFINEGKRIIAGGDEPKLIVMETSGGNNNGNKSSTIIDLPNLVLNLSYNAIGEMIAVSLLDQSVQIYSVTNEKPILLESLTNYIPEKVYTTLEGELSDEEKICCKTFWSPNGESIYIPNNKSVNVYSRSSFKTISTTVGQLESPLLDFDVSNDGKLVAMITKDTLHIYSTSKNNEILNTPVSNVNAVKWGNQRQLFVSVNNGLYQVFEDDFGEQEPRKRSKFIDDAAEEDSETEEADGVPVDELDDFLFNDESEADGLSAPTHLEETGIIDEDDDILMDSSRKRQRTNGYISNQQVNLRRTKLKPYSQGSTPWSDSSNQSRKYLTMNHLGYTWSVRSGSGNVGEPNQSITVSFFDRAKNKDYHFTDYNGYDICLMNSRGLLLGCLGYNTKKSGENAGKLFYRNHESLQDSWEILVSLLEGEYITCIALTSDESELVVVGTSQGYLRFFNLHGVCIFLMRYSPVVALILSGTTLFTINESNNNGGSYTYSIINVNEDYKFLQQDVVLHMSSTDTLQGLFFNENNDPCIVLGNSNTLLILSDWRESGNAKWIPLIHLSDSVTESGNNPAKKNWHAWPLGLYKDEVSVLVLKSGGKYPGFPLPLPVDIEIRLPVGGGEDEEAFLRSLTMGRIVNASLADVETEETNNSLLERLEMYSIAFDRSLLKLFASLCQEGQISKANSVARLMKTDKALFAALKIAERMEYISLATKIAKLREALIED